MKSFLRSAVLTATLIGLALVAGQPLALLAQTALTATTLSAALAAPAQGNPATIVTLTSGSGVSAGVGLAVDNEYMVVQGKNPDTSTNTTRWNVTRGQSGTQASAHASGAGVLLSASNNFGFNQTGPVGPCTSTLVQALPLVQVTNTGLNIYACPAVNSLAGSTASAWDWVQAQGYARPNPARTTGWTYVTAGALTIQNGHVSIGSAGALAMTLAAPSLWQNGTTMVLMASTAQAHTITYTAGFDGDTTGSDVATFGGAVGDFLVIEAVNGAWRRIASVNVTIA